MEEYVNTSEMLNMKIADLLRELDQHPVGSDEWVAVKDAISELYRLKIDENKVEWDADEKIKERENSEESERRQARNHKLEFGINTGLAVFGVVVPLMLNHRYYNRLTDKMFAFERGDSLSSVTSRNIANLATLKKG